MKAGLKNMEINVHEVNQNNDNIPMQLVEYGNQYFFYFSLKEICKKWNLHFDLQKDVEKVYDGFKHLFTFEDGKTEEEDEIIEQLIDSSIILDEDNKDNDFWINYDYLLSAMSYMFSPEVALNVYKYLEKKMFAYKYGNQDFLDMILNNEDEDVE